jgi:3',5'-cyclic AMP phosphodiesterase CpdA
MKFVHLSDLHFGRHVSREKERSLAEDIIAREPDLLVITGDLTDTGAISQFKWARRFLESFDIPFITVPGNREVSFTAAWEWIMPRFAMRRYSIFFGPKDRIVYRSENHGAVFFGLNSVHAFPAWTGKISRETRYWLRDEAARHPNYTKVLFLHHPVLPVIRSSSFWAHSLSEAGELLNIATQTGISLILQGHKHRSSVMEIRFPERDSRVIVLSAGAPLMPYWDCAYHVIRLTNSSIDIEPREFQDGTFKGSASYKFSTDGK